MYYLFICIVSGHHKLPHMKNVKQLHKYSLPYAPSGITVTSTGDLAIVEHYGINVSIFTTHGRLVRSLNVTGASKLMGISRSDQNFFITDSENGKIHVITENNLYITSMYTGFQNMRFLSVTNHTIWFSHEYGLYKLMFDASYDIIMKTPVVRSASHSLFYFPSGVTLVQSGLIITCYLSHNIHFLSFSGDRLYPPAGGEGPMDGQLNKPNDVSTDESNTVYVTDEANQRIAVFTETGQFITNLMTAQDGLGYPTTLVVHKKYLYITDLFPFTLHVVELS